MTDGATEAGVSSTPTVLSTGGCCKAARRRACGPQSRRLRPEPGGDSVPQRRRPVPGAARGDPSDGRLGVLLLLLGGLVGLAAAFVLQLGATVPHHPDQRVRHRPQRAPRRAARTARLVPVLTDYAPLIVIVLYLLIIGLAAQRF